MISKRGIIGTRKVSEYLEKHTWSKRDDLVDLYNEMMPEPFKGEIYRNEIGEIAWITSGRDTVAIFKREQDLRENFDLILLNWDK